MKSPMRWLAKLVFLLLVVVMLLVGLVLAWFTSWRADQLAALHGGSEVAETRAGRIEYVDEGEGPAVLVLHGAPGGYDQARLLGAELQSAGFRVIAPSRPGYLRTPLETGLFPAQEADAMAALLDERGVATTAVVGFSEGGPVAVQLALRHPGRVRAMVLLSAVTGPFSPNGKAGDKEFGREILHGLTGDVGSWLAVKVSERQSARGLDWLFALTSLQEGPALGTQVAWVEAHEDQLDWYRGLVLSFAPLSPREVGTRNDLRNVRAMEAPPWDQLTVPTLMIHGADDRCLPIAEAEAVVAKIPGATFLKVPEAGHLVPLSVNAGEVNQALAKFLQRHTGGETAP